MRTHATPPLDTLDRFLVGQLAIDDVAQWVYQTDTLGAVIGSDWDDALPGFDYRQPDADHALRRLVRRTYQDICPGEATERLLWQIDIMAECYIMRPSAAF